jgi:hypothetical protein
MKRSFTGPVWLLIFGLIEGAFAWGVLQLISELYLPRGGTPLISAATIVYTLMWPVILSFAFVLHDSVFMLTILHSPLVGGCIRGEGEMWRRGCTGG